MLKELIIKVDNHAVQLCPELSVAIQQTNIPIEHCKFRSHEQIFWKVQVIEYNSDSKCWKMKVIDYHANDISNFYRQKPTSDVVRIAFEPFDWLQFERNLSSYQKIKLLEVLDNHNTNHFFREETTDNSRFTFYANDLPKEPIENALQKGESSPNENAHLERSPIIAIHNIEFTVYFSDSYFMLGYVTFKKRVIEIDENVDFQIKNDFLLPEFDNIKSWFAKKLKTKKFTVKATISTIDGKLSEVTATSPQIALIDAEFIDSVKFQRTIALTNSPRITEINKSLFSADEIFENLETENLEGNVFKQNEQAIFSFLLDNFKTRNRKYLEYLAGSKQTENSTLRFTLHPHFGFLFCIEGEQNNHFIWELLNSHATYMWSIEKSEKAIEMQYKRIENSINIIRESGRQNYKRAYRQNHHDNDLIFCIIEHEKISSIFVDGFVTWKRRLNERIT